MLLVSGLILVDMDDVVELDCAFRCRRWNHESI
jgi:hypothetical protein